MPSCLKLQLKGWPTSTPILRLGPPRPPSRRIKRLLEEAHTGRGTASISRAKVDVRKLLIDQQNRKTDFVNARRPMLNAFSGRQQQPLLIRICHWFNAVFITVMAGSGLQILTAYPALGSRGEQYWWYPFQNVAPPSWLKIGGWLEGGRHWHFTIGGSS
jgi:hypothetical protein